MRAPVASLHKFRGVLDAKAAEGKFTLTRYWPAEHVGFFVERYWIVRWDLDEPYVQATAPNPCVNLVVEPASSGVFGVPTGSFARTLAGRGCTFGVKFKPGGFYPFFRSPISDLRDRMLELEKVFGEDGAALVDELRSLDEDEQMVEAAEAFFQHRLPEPDGNVVLVNQIVDHIVAEDTVQKVADLATAFGRSERSLQRLFHKYVGVGPRWVIARYRLQEAVCRIESDPVVKWSDVAAELGYFDQSHFVRDFKRIVGVTPAEYARKIRGERAPTPCIDQAPVARSV